MPGRDGRRLAHKALANSFGGHCHNLTVMGIGVPSDFIVGCLIAPGNPSLSCVTGELFEKGTCTASLDDIVELVRLPAVFALLGAA